MQTKTPFFNEAAKAFENAIGMAQAAGEEARAAMRAQADRYAAELDLVRRDELDALRAAMNSEIQQLRSEIAQMKAPAAKARPADDLG